MNYYNDNDPFCCEWLQNLIDAGLIPPGDVDARSIADVTPDQLDKYTQCHFFAGLGGWPFALRLAGWPETEKVWTGSCPCQPFSSAGRGLAEKDSRHLWPEFYRLIRECRPEVVFGEQVASAEVIGTQLEAAFVVAIQCGDYARANKLAKRLVKSHGFHYWARWVDRVHADLEAADYTLRYKVLGAHSVGAPHIRQRIFWVAQSSGRRLEVGQVPARPGDQGEGTADQRGVLGGLVDSTGRGLGEYRSAPGDSRHADQRREADRLEHAPDPRCQETGQQGQSGGRGRMPGARCGTGRLGDTASQEPRCGQQRLRQGGGRGDGTSPDEEWPPWINSQLILCRDGKTRRIPSPESGIFPLAHGIPTKPSDPRMGYLLARLAELGHDTKAARRILKEAKRNRVGRLRGYGNAIVPQIAAVFITSYLQDKNP